ncbi:MAG: leucine-rich repeat domain-containing protein [Phycisphaerales bacterium]|nr:MAG: leucine-rich repeat domain-containing protein [Phycisphaerales bacterium]
MRTRTALMILTICFTPNSLRAEDPIDFPDANLKAAVEDALWLWDPTPTDMLGLTELVCPIGYIGHRQENAIRDLTGLEHAKNLQTLNLLYHLISDLSPLSALTNLQTLVLQENEAITDISPLSSLTSLKTLDLETNQVTDISALSGLTNLQTLNLHKNNVRDISALSGLTSLGFLDLRINPLNREAYDVYIPLIITNNPGITLLRDPSYLLGLTISSGTGGSVTKPGEGLFEYEYLETLWLEAEADPGFMFSHWSGTYFSASNPEFLTVYGGGHIRACFVSESDVLAVDDDAPHDPGPGDSTVSDPQEDGTPEHPFDEIQEAVDVAADGASVVVRPGTYRETIDLLGKSIRLIGGDSHSTPRAVIDGAGAGPIVRFTTNEDPGCVLTGFVMTRGKGDLAGAIHCRGSSPTISNCLVVGNQATDLNGSAVYCDGSNAVLINCTVADNCGGGQGGAVSLVDSNVVLTNSVVWHNAPAQIVTGGMSESLIRYSDIAGGWPGEGNIEDDPLFVRRGYWADPSDPNVAVDPNDPMGVWVDGDYHLRSQAGRWDPATEVWATDQATSPCIDAGDLNSPIGREPFPGGGVINMGAYGGTTEASKSYFGDPACETIAAGDINGDCKVDWLDAGIMCQHWLEDNSP